jgi:hypothetical protein
MAIPAAAANAVPRDEERDVHAAGERRLGVPRYRAPEGRAT